MRSFILVMVLLTVSAPGLACSFRLGTETSFRPFIDFNNNNWQGVTIELLQMLKRFRALRLNSYAMSHHYTRRLLPLVNG